MTKGERIRQVRQGLGLTQGKFAERIAISFGYLSGMECGDKRVNERVIRLISMEFGVNEHWLHTGEGEMYSESADIALVKATSIFKLLNPKHREYALAQLDGLLDLQNVGNR